MILAPVIPLAQVDIGGNCYEVGSLNGLRTAAKIAYAGLDIRLERSSQSVFLFNSCVIFIAEGVGEKVVRLFGKKAVCRSKPAGATPALVDSRRSAR